MATTLWSLLRNSIACLWFAGLPEQLEYDWIGENLYFITGASGHGGKIGLCSTATGECTIVRRWSVTISGDSLLKPCIAVDPSNGYSP